MSDDKKQNAPIKDETLDNVSGGVPSGAVPRTPHPINPMPPPAGPPTHPGPGK